MATSKVLGYNIGLYMGDAVIYGKTQDEFKVSATTKESITKDDAGVKNVAVTGHDATFSVSGVITIGGASASGKDRDALLALALQTGSAAEWSFKYRLLGGKVVSGTCIITSYSESSDSESEGTYSLECQTTGPITVGTGS